LYIGSKGLIEQDFIEKVALESWAEDYKLRFETSLKSQASDWLKWRLVSIVSFITSGPTNACGQNTCSSRRIKNCLLRSCKDLVDSSITGSVTRVM
jgi:hypothetical protein